MPAPRGSTFDRLLGRLGGMLEDVEHVRQGKAGAAEAVTDLRRVATAWIIGRTLRPRHVNWPRLLAATATGVILGEVAEAVLGSRARGRRLPVGRTHVLGDDELAEEWSDTRTSEVAPEADELDDVGPRSARRAAEAAEGVEEESVSDEEEETFVEEMEEVGPRSRRRALADKEVEDTSDHVRHILERAGADLAIAATYAAVAYPRLPGPRLLRAAVFAAADVAVSSGGGIATALADLSPRTRLPLARLLPDEERRIEHSLALALALGLIYKDEDEEDDEDDD